MHRRLFLLEMQHSHSVERPLAAHLQRLWPRSSLHQNKESSVNYHSSENDNDTKPHHHKEVLRYDPSYDSPWFLCFGYSSHPASRCSYQKVPIWHNREEQSHCSITYRHNSPSLQKHIVHEQISTLPQVCVRYVEKKQKGKIYTPSKKEL